LGRGCGVYKAPRNVLKHAVKLLYLSNEKEKSFCCGFNLGNTALEKEEQKKIRDSALQNLLESKPELIATACPMCKKAFMHGVDFPVKDVAEIISENLKSINPN
jgi:Fe-S oxidoreductase